jgi:hypothetical protein
MIVPGGGISLDGERWVARAGPASLRRELPDRHVFDHAPA